MKRDTIVYQTHFEYPMKINQYITLKKCNITIGCAMFEIHCSNCNKESSFFSHALNYNHDKETSIEQVKCKYCENFSYESFKKGNFRLYHNRVWSEYSSVGMIRRSQYNRIKLNAKARDIKFNITIKEMWDLFEEQNGRCKFTGLQLLFEHYNRKRRSGENPNETTASFDRIDSNGPYTKENCQWVHTTVNFMKSNLHDQEFLNWVKLISDNRFKNEILN